MAVAVGEGPGVNVAVAVSDGPGVGVRVMVGVAVGDACTVNDAER